MSQLGINFEPHTNRQHEELKVSLIIKLEDYFLEIKINRLKV